MEYMCNFWNFGKWPSWFSSRASRPMGLLFIRVTFVGKTVDIMTAGIEEYRTKV